MEQIFISEKAKRIAELRAPFWQTHLFAQMLSEKITASDNPLHRQYIRKLIAKDRPQILISFPDESDRNGVSMSLVQSLDLVNNSFKSLLSNNYSLWSASPYNGVVEHIHMLAKEAQELYFAAMFRCESARERNYNFSSDLPYPLREPYVSFTVQFKKDLLEQFEFLLRSIGSLATDLLTHLQARSPSPTQIATLMSKDFLPEKRFSFDREHLDVLVEEYKKTLPTPPSIEVLEPDLTSKSGFVYLLSNPSMPRLLKVGKTTRPIDERVKELGAATGVPTPFELVYRVHVSDCDEGEKFAHSRLDQYRSKANREFFRVPAYIAIDVLVEAVANDNALS